MNNHCEDCAPEFGCWDGSEPCQKRPLKRSADPAGSAPYDPLASLKVEVKRFQDTNTFSPLMVTHFYAQAACVVRELEEARKALAAPRPQPASLTWIGQAMAAGGTLTVNCILHGNSICAARMSWPGETDVAGKVGVGLQSALLELDGALMLDCAKEMMESGVV